MVHAIDLYNCRDLELLDVVGRDYDWIAPDGNGAQRAVNMIMEEHAYKWGTYVEDGFGRNWGDSEQYRIIMNDIKAYGLEGLLKK